MAHKALGPLPSFLPKVGGRRRERAGSSRDSPQRPLFPEGKGHESGTVPGIGIQVLQKSSRSHGLQILAQSAEAHTKAGGTNGSLPGPGVAELNSPGSCRCEERRVSRKQGEGAAGPSLVTCLGCSRDLGQGHPSRSGFLLLPWGCGRSGLTLTKSLLL